MSSMLAQPPPSPMTQNPMLPQHPVTAALDAKYYADEAVLRQQIAQKHADLLQQLGYTDNQGNFIPGSVQTNAARQTTDLQRSSDLAAEDVNNQAQRTGTVFSGHRPRDIGRAEYPYQNQIAQLGVDTPMQLGQLHEQAAGLVDQYTLQNNQLMADAAQRASQSITQSPTATGANGPVTNALGTGGAQMVGGEPKPGAENFHQTVQAIHNASLKALQNNPHVDQTARNAV